VFGVRVCIAFLASRLYPSPTTIASVAIRIFGRSGSTREQQKINETTGGGGGGGGGGGM